jgi:uncharacterized protein (TIGR02265 family)
MQIRGTVLHARKTFVKEHFGSEAWEKVLQALSDESKEVFQGLIISAGWYPFSVGENLDQAIVDILGKGNPKIFEEIGVQSARDNLSGAHKTFLAQGNPQYFMATANTIYQFYYDTGYRTYEKTGPTSGIMTTHEAETFSTPDCFTVIGWYKEALKMCGAKNVQMEEETCRAKGGPYCRYRVQWEM